MTITELKNQYAWHNVAFPHSEGTCEICQKYFHRFDKPYMNMNGNNF